MVNTVQAKVVDVNEGKTSGRKITRIFDELYDLEGFQHPGGENALSMAFGRDVTELFHTSHQFVDQAKLKQVLQKYKYTETGPSAVVIPANGVYNWKETLESDFYKELRQLTDPIFARYGTKQSWYRSLEIAIMFLLLIWQYGQFAQGYWYTIFTFPTFIWLIAVNVAHDAGHFAVSHTPLINDLFFQLMNFNTSTFYWNHQHVIGHHNFPNVPYMDPDIYTVKLFRHSKFDPLIPAHKNQTLVYMLLASIRMPLSYLLQTYRLYLCKDFLGFFPLATSSLCNKQMMLWQTVIILSIFHILPFLFHGLTWKGVCFAFVPHMVFSWHYIINVSFNHQHPLNDEGFHTNFYIHQIITGHNVDVSTWWNYWVYLYSGGLCYQIEHHLFPTVNHCHLWRIRPIVQALCAKYGIVYNISPSMWTAWRGFIDHMEKMTTCDATKTTAAANGKVDQQEVLQSVTDEKSRDEYLRQLLLSKTPPTNVRSNIRQLNKLKKQN
jgi:fatty acid desaturase